MSYLRPDSKSQVTIEYDENNKPIRIDTIVVSTQHDEFDTEENMLKQIDNDVKNYLIPRVKATQSDEIRELFDDKIVYHTNPTGKFVIGGPHVEQSIAHCHTT